MLPVTYMQMTEQDRCTAVLYIMVSLDRRNLDSISLGRDQALQV